MAQSVWTLRNPLTQTTTLQASTWAAGLSKFFAVGDNGTIVSSADGVNWAIHSTGTKSLYGVAWGNNKLVAVGATGTILTSTNGSSWFAAPTNPATKNLLAVTWTGSQFVAVGAGGEVVTSSTGDSWALEDSKVTADLNGVVAEGSRVVAVGAGGTVAVRDAGTWAARYAGVNVILFSVTFVGGQFIAVGNSGTIRGSQDGVTWNQKNGPSGAQWTSVTFGNQQFLVVGSNGRVATSPDGDVWTEGTTLIGNPAMRSVVWNGTRFLAVGVGGALATSTTGSNWTIMNSSRAALNGAASSANTFLAVGDAGTILSSGDLVSWKRRNSGVTDNLQAAVWTGTRWIAAGKGGALLTSTDTATWAENASWEGLASADVYALSSDGASAVVAAGPSDAIRTSSDGGVTWAVRSSSPTGNTYYGATHAGSLMFIMGLMGNPSTTQGGALRGSTNGGLNWVSRTTNLPNTVRLTAGAYAASLSPPTLVVVGSAGTILYSTNAPNFTTWTSASSGTNVMLNSVKWTGTQFVAVGAGGVVLTSPDGIAWGPRASGVTAGLNAVTWSGSMLMAGGDAGLILTSDPAATPPVPVLAAPADGASGVPVNPSLTWEASSGADTYRVQVSTSESFGTVLKDSAGITGRSLKVGPLTASSTYFWRVNATGSTGTSAWSGANDFMVVAAAQSAPALVYPPADTTNIPTSITLSWNPYTATGTVTYNLQVSTDPTFATFFQNDPALAGTTRVLNGLAENTDYYWRVSATFPAGTTAFSTTRKFRTTPPAPAAPALNLPADAAFNVQNGASLSWFPVAGASTYCVQVSTANSFATTLINDCTVTGNTKTLAGLSANQSYYWRVSASNGGGTSLYSAIRGFTTATGPPAKPLLGTPANNATEVDVFADVAWSNATGASTYHVQVATDSNFVSGFVLNDSNLTVLTRNVGQLANQTRYYWRVIARNPAGSTTSDRRTFMSGSAPTTVPPTPNLSSGVTPVQFTTVAVNPTNFSWGAVATARRYHLIVATDPSFAPGTIVVNDSSIASTSKAVNGLSGSGTYYWYLRAWNNVGWGAFSSPAKQFYTVATTPVAPEPFLPALYATGVSVTPTLVWKKVLGAATYRVQVSVSPTLLSNGQFATTVFNDSMVTDTTRAVGTLADNRVYYWQVQAKNSAGSSGYGQSMFTTGSAPLPAVPELTSPALYATEVPVNTAYAWLPASGAVTYHFQLSTEPTFTTGLLANDSLLLATSRTAVALQKGTPYFWQVRAKNSAGYSEFAASMFTTEKAVAILPAKFSFLRSSFTSAEALRFGLPTRERVVIRMFDTRGAQVAPDFDRVLEAGYHSLPLPAALNGSFFLIDFRAGDMRKVLKIHP